MSYEDRVDHFADDIEGRRPPTCGGSGHTPESLFILLSIDPAFHDARSNAI
jgi:hypothetical protein